MSLGLILLIVLVVFLVGGFGDRVGAPWGYGYGYGGRGMGGLFGLLIIVVIILLITGNLRI